MTDSLAIFDLDNTLIAGDSDVLWGDYLAERGHVDPVEHRRRHDRYYADYLAGKLDIFEFLAFQFEVLATHDMQTLRAWRDGLIEEKICPIVLPKAQALVAAHREQGSTLLIVTATNRFITEPIAALFGVEHLIATEPEIAGDRYTGRVQGTPAFSGGKVTRLDAWLEGRGLELSRSWFYSDSHNDLPLLRCVGHPVAVDPDPLLAATARERRWPIISLRDGSAMPGARDVRAFPVVD